MKRMLRHVAIIMDGNRRWARKHKLTALAGHDYVAERVLEPLVDRALALGISHLTFWAFSTENWKREQREVEGIMRIFRKGLQRSAKRLFQKGVRLRILGDIDRFPADIAEMAKAWVRKSKGNKRITVAFAINYGGRDELLRAIRRMLMAQLRNAASRRLLIQPFREPVASMDDRRDEEIVSRLSRLVTEEKFAKYLDTEGMPDPDLIIRTGGEQRLSGFLIWQSVYSEFYFTKTLMPDFSPEDFERAIGEYQQRKRRFGR